MPKKTVSLALEQLEKHKISYPARLRLLAITTITEDITPEAQ